MSCWKSETQYGISFAVVPCLGRISFNLFGYSLERRYFSSTARLRLKYEWFKISWSFFFGGGRE
jgi:hypothetical protein